MRPNPDESGRGVPVIDVAPGIGTAGHLEDGSVRAKAADSLLHDRARRHRDLDHVLPTCRAGRGDVDSLIERPVAGAEDPADRPEREHPAARRRGLATGAAADLDLLGDVRQQRGGGDRTHDAVDRQLGRRLESPHLPTGDRPEIPGGGNLQTDVCQPGLESLDIGAAVAVPEHASEHGAAASRSGADVALALLLGDGRLERGGRDRADHAVHSQLPRGLEALDRAPGDRAEYSARSHSVADVVQPAL